jgi:hypothetical protein
MVEFMEAEDPAVKPNSDQRGHEAEVGPTPVFSIEDLVLGDRTKFLPVRIIVVRLVFLMLILIAASAIVVGLLRLAASG